MRVIQANHTDRQSTFIVRAATATHDPAWALEPLSLEDLVLTYMAQATAEPGRRPARETQR